MTNDSDVTPSEHGSSAALRAQEKEVRREFGPCEEDSIQSILAIIKNAVAKERRECAQLLMTKSREEDDCAELASATGEHESATNSRRRSEAYCAAAAFIMARDLNEPRGLSAAETPSSVEGVNPFPDLTKSEG